LRLIAFHGLSDRRRHLIAKANIFEPTCHTRLARTGARFVSAVCNRSVCSNSTAATLHLAERGHDVVADHRSIVLLCVRGQLGDVLGIKASAQLGDRWRGTFRRLLANRIGAEIDIALDPLCHLARRCRRPVRKRADCRAPL